MLEQDGPAMEPGERQMCDVGQEELEDHVQ